VEVSVTEAKKYDGGRIMISVTEETRGIMDRNVGFSKRFRTKSSLVDYAVKQYFGSAKQKTEDHRLELLSELETLITDLRKLRAKEDNETCISAAGSLSTFYNMPIGIALVEKVQSDWDEHWDEEEGYAIWKDEKGRPQVRIVVKDSVLRAIVVAMKADELNRKIERLQNELKALRDNS